MHWKVRFDALVCLIRLGFIGLDTPDTDTIDWIDGIAAQWMSGFARAALIRAKTCPLSQRWPPQAAVSSTRQQRVLLATLTAQRLGGSVARGAAAKRAVEERKRVLQTLVHRRQQQGGWEQSRNLSASLGGQTSSEKTSVGCQISANLQSQNLSSVDKPDVEQPRVEPQQEQSRSWIEQGKHCVGRQISGENSLVVEPSCQARAGRRSIVDRDKGFGRLVGWVREQLAQVLGWKSLMDCTAALLPSGTPLGTQADHVSVLSYNLLAPLYVRTIDKRTGLPQEYAKFGKRDKRPREMCLLVCFVS